MNKTNRYPNNGGNRYIAPSNKFIATKDVLILLNLNTYRFWKLTRALGIQPVSLGIWSKAMIDRIRHIPRSYMNEKGEINWEEMRNGRYN
jgi:hypothetical protein